MSADLAIESEGLAKSYGSVPVLAGLDLRVPAASCYALLGRNGAGKTTTVRILSTLVRPDAGRATVAGCDLLADTRTLRGRISLSGQYAAWTGCRPEMRTCGWSPGSPGYRGVWPDGARRR
jgi:ABC-2 type transport system ATP-binding protein